MSRAPFGHPQFRPLASERSGALTGRVRVPGDKSISHRALLLGALSTGVTRISGLLEAEDVLNTAKAVTALGAPAARRGAIWEVLGRGAGGLTEPRGAIDFGNSGTATRLAMGVIASNDIEVELTGDVSLARRPMRRVLEPLQRMGLAVAGSRERLPVVIRGTSSLLPIEYETPVASAQVKSAILLAGLGAVGETTVIEREATRDHTERMLRHFGAGIRVARREGKAAITVTGDGELEGREVTVPGDPSSAAFLTAAALIVPGSDIIIENVLANETRSGFYRTLAEMGADVTPLELRDESGEPVADIRVRHSRLKGVHVPAARVPSMIDEYPILSVLAAFADGETRMDGLAELRVKESDRLMATAAGLAANGIQVRVAGDDLVVRGAPRPRGGGEIATHMDHRIAMAFLVLGLGTDRPVTVDDTSFVATSFPSFEATMTSLGAKFRPAV